MNWERRKQSEDWARRMAYEFDKANSLLTFAEFCYEQGKADGVREFAEWLANGNTFIRRIGTERLTTIDEIILEYEKEQK